MARKQEDNGVDHPEEPDLAPFMNMVIILIPMLLLSVVFIEIAVINVTMPLGGTATEDTEEEEESLDLSIALSTDGFYVTAVGEQQEPIEGCPTQGPTICLEDPDVDVEAAFEDARTELRTGSTTRGEELMEDGLRAYNYRELYNMLVQFKDDFPDETTFRLSADSDIPFALSVRTMDVARHRLEEDSYDDTEAFWRADFSIETDETGDDVYENLFPDPAFAVHQ